MPAPPHTWPPERKLLPVLEALERRYGRARRPRYDPLEVLVRGVLSQNTSDANSGRAYQELRDRFPTGHQLGAAQVGAVEKAIRSAGLAAQKSATLCRVLRHLKRRFGEYSLEPLRTQDPLEAEAELSAIKGVGIKTARLTLLFGFGMPLFVVDTHVHRVALRLGLIPPRCARERAHALLDELVPDARKYSMHMSMIRHGRTLCRAHNPLCEPCPVRDYCVFLRKASPPRPA